MAQVKRPRKKCDEPGCKVPALARGKCYKHLVEKLGVDALPPSMRKRTTKPAGTTRAKAAAPAMPQQKGSDDQEIVRKAINVLMDLSFLKTSREQEQSYELWSNGDKMALVLKGVAPAAKKTAAPRKARRKRTRK